jgi:signal peptidase II
MYEYKKKFLPLIFFLLVFLDQMSKYLIRYSGGFYICNKGIAFGIKLPDIIFWIFWLVIIFFIFFILYKKHFAHYSPHIILILSGSVSNILDRLYFGCIIDFIDFKIWPVFNLADSFIVLSVILILLNQLKKHDI